MRSTRGEGPRLPRARRWYRGRGGNIRTDGKRTAGEKKRTERKEKREREGGGRRNKVLTRGAASRADSMTLRGLGGPRRGPRDFHRAAKRARDGNRLLRGVVPFLWRSSPPRHQCPSSWYRSIGAPLFPSGNPGASALSSEYARHVNSAGEREREGESEVRSFGARAHAGPALKGQRVNGV